MSHVSLAITPLSETSNLSLTLQVLGKLLFELIYYGSIVVVALVTAVIVYIVIPKLISKRMEHMYKHCEDKEGIRMKCLACGYSTAVHPTFFMAENEIISHECFDIYNPDNPHNPQG